MAIWSTRSIFGHIASSVYPKYGSRLNGIDSTASIHGMDSSMTHDIVPSACFRQVQQWKVGKGSRPPAGHVVDALLAAEKARRNQPSWTYDDLQGTWQLSFITGTKASQERAGVVLGAGRFVPRWITVSLTYTPDAPIALDASEAPLGWSHNRVALGETGMTVSGPTKLWPRGILAFDFTRMSLGLGPWSLLEVPIRNGRDREAKFYQLPVKQQAFFHYFWVEQDYIAARGRGGGLALWTRAEGPDR
ncbi:MAG: hypothetical protein WBA10_15145 [Elainellaceae cyanobacterium]